MYYVLCNEMAKVRKSFGISKDSFQELKRLPENMAQGLKLSLDYLVECSRVPKIYLPCNGSCGGGQTLQGSFSIICTIIRLKMYNDSVLITTTQLNGNCDKITIIQF